MAILSLAAFYAPDGIPEELFPQAAEYTIRQSSLSRERALRGEIRQGCRAWAERGNQKAGGEGPPRASCI